VVVCLVNRAHVRGERPPANNFSFHVRCPTPSLSLMLASIQIEGVELRQKKRSEKERVVSVKPGPRGESDIQIVSFLSPPER